MQIEVSGIGITITEALRVHAERRARAAVSGFFGRINHIVVALKALAPPQRHTNTECRIRIVIVGRRNLTEAYAASDIYIAVDGAADRVSKSLALRLG